MYLEKLLAYDKKACIALKVKKKLKKYMKKKKKHIIKQAIVLDEIKPLKKALNEGLI